MGNLLKYRSGFTPLETVAECIKMSFPRPALRDPAMREKPAALPLGRRESINLIKSIYLDCPVKPGNDKNGVSQQSPLETIEKSARKRMSLSGFTLLELLIVISIIAILAATIVPNFIGFDAEARLSATQTNLNTLRTRIVLYRAKEGEYPVSLNDFLTKTYDDMGIQQSYLEKIPPELISSKSGDSSFEDISVEDEQAGDGGWVYFREKARVAVDIKEPLDSKWGKSKGEVPSTW